MMGSVNIPLCTTNRINAPETIEDVIASGKADMVSMARPFLADPNFVLKAMEGKAEEINTCIGCNQACLDHVFQTKTASCLVNPRACHETSLVVKPLGASGAVKQRVAVIGAGPAGLSCAVTAAERGHEVTLFEKDSQIGGQFNMAKLVPGKEEFHETLRYFGNMLKKHKVNLRVSTEATLESLSGNFDSIVVATGVIPRDPLIPNNSNGKVSMVSYIDVLKGKVKVGARVAIVGAGGIGFDVADYLTHPHNSAIKHGPNGENVPLLDDAAINEFLNEWNIDTKINAGGVLPADAVGEKARIPRKVYLLQRKKGKLGAGLGKTTGWIHRTVLKKREVEEIDNCKYVEVSEAGLVIERMGERRVLEVDTVVQCAGQVSYKPLHDQLQARGDKAKLFLIGGAHEAGELDAKRAIDQGVRLAAQIETCQSGAVFEAPVSAAFRAKTMWEEVQSKGLKALFSSK